MARRKEGRRGLIAWRWSSHGLCVGSDRNAIYLYVTMKHCLFLPSKFHLSPPSSEISRLPRSFDALPGKSQTFQLYLIQSRDHLPLFLALSRSPSISTLFTALCENPKHSVHLVSLCQTPQEQLFTAIIKSLLHIAP